MTYRRKQGYRSLNTDINALFERQTFNLRIHRAWTMMLKTIARAFENKE